MKALKQNLSFLPQVRGQNSPGGSDGRVCLQCVRPRFDPWVGKIPWRRKWQPTPVLLPWKAHGWGAWWTTVHGVIKNRTPLSNQHFQRWGLRMHQKTDEKLVWPGADSRQYVCCFRRRNGEWRWTHCTPAHWGVTWCSHEEWEDGASPNLLLLSFQSIRLRRPSLKCDVHLAGAGSINLAKQDIFTTK